MSTIEFECFRSTPASINCGVTQVILRNDVAAGQGNSVVDEC